MDIKANQTELLNIVEPFVIHRTGSHCSYNACLFFFWGGGDYMSFSIQNEYTNTSEHKLINVNTVTFQVAFPKGIDSRSGAPPKSNH